MILFVGTTHESYFAKKIVETRGEEFQFMDDIQEISYLVNNIIRTGARTIILDISQYTEDIPVIMEAVIQIQDALDCKFIIMAKGYPAGSQIVQAFYNAGHTDFILNNVLSLAQEELEKCLDGVYVRDGAPEEIVEAAKNAKKEMPDTKRTGEILKLVKDAQKKKISIGVAGTKHYIGTTTQVIQIAKYFMQAGQKTAVVEINTSGFFDTWRQMLEESEYHFDSGLSLMKLKKVDIFLDPEQITKNIRQRYDCIVYDYGCYFDEDFQRISYYERDINCLVGGSKVNEYEMTNQALVENKDRDNMYYLFSFTSKADAADIAKSMMKKAEHTMFPAYTPDMFIYSPDNNYERFFKYKLQADRKAAKKESRFSIFRRREEA